MLTDVQSCPCHNDSLVPIALSKEDVGQSYVPHVLSCPGGKIDGTSQAFDGLGGVSHHPPIQGRNAEQGPMWGVLEGEGVEKWVMTA